jgi:diguanylate cyclase (GGDEF)-like protein
MKQKKITIQALILTLMTFAMLGTFVGSVFSSVIVSKENLENNYLKENQYYAQKLASTTNSLFTNMLKTLNANGSYLSSMMVSKDIQTIHGEMARMNAATDYFNSVLLVDQTGTILSNTPNQNLEGQKLFTTGGKEALSKKTPLISQPYLGITGKLLILVSYPIFAPDGSYLGFIAGTIYLNEENSLKKILGLHPEHFNQSYVYVVDSSGNIIYHPDSKRINDNARQNKVVQLVMKGKSGNLEVSNTKGISMLAGYAFVETSHWGVVSQTPKESIIEPTFEMATEVVKFTVPFMVFVFLVSLLVLKRIVNPLRKLADFAHDIMENQSLPLPKIPENFFELKELKKSIFVMVEFYKKQIKVFENEAIHDPLTGLHNRRSFNKQMNEMTAYSIILLDIDHFKSVNDEYGHLMGDEVLKFLAELVKKQTRESDMCFRFGGEEFLVLLPDTDMDTTQVIAEHLRRSIESTVSPIGRSITVSIGIGNRPETASHPTELFHLIDQALYKAKNDGRNRIVSANDL